MGFITLVIGATLASLASRSEEARELNDALWRAHFVAMAGSLVVATALARAKTVSLPAVIGAFITSWAFLGAWGVGLAWIAWVLALRADPAARAR